MAQRLTILTPSISAGATISLMQEDTTAKALASATNPRAIKGIGFSGATVNTGTMKVYIASEEIFQTRNGVTNTAGAPIRQDDVTPLEELINTNENFDVQITNSSGGALQYYVYVEIEE